MAREQSPQQHLVHATAKPLAAVKRDDRHAFVVAGLQFAILVDVDAREVQPIARQQRGGIFAQVAATARIEHDLWRGAGHVARWQKPCWQAIVWSELV